MTLEARWIALGITMLLHDEYAVVPAHVAPAVHSEAEEALGMTTQVERHGPGARQRKIVRVG